MTNDDINQKLALLPEQIKENNYQSWLKIVSFYKHQTDHPIRNDLPGIFYNEALLALYGLAKDFSKTEQAKLFRAGTSVNGLLISTADKHGLRVGDLLITVTFRKANIVIQYEVSSPITMEENPNIIERISCDLNNNLMPVLQPLLNLLWDKTRGNKNIQ